MSWGAIYAVSWWGNTNEDVGVSNGWGSIYPFNADASYLRADTILIKADSISYKADATQY